MNDIYQNNLCFHIPQCIAKTLHNKRCKKNAINNNFLCRQHYKICQNFFEKFTTESQIGGFSVGIQNYGKIFSTLIPSCLDILQCDWITDITSAIPFLPLLIKLASYR